VCARTSYLWLCRLALALMFCLPFETPVERGTRPFAKNVLSGYGIGETLFPLFFCWPFSAV